MEDVLELVQDLGYALRVGPHVLHLLEAVIECRVHRTALANSFTVFACFSVTVIGAWVASTLATVRTGNVAA